MESWALLRSMGFIIMKLAVASLYKLVGAKRGNAAAPEHRKMINPKRHYITPLDFQEAMMRPQKAKLRTKDGYR
jgi:hypothetical protein